MSAFKNLQAAFEAGEQGITVLGLLQPGSPEGFAGSIEAMKDNESWIEFAGDAADRLSKAKTDLISGLDSAGLIDHDYPGASSEMLTALNSLATARTAMGVVDSMAVQAQTIEGILRSVSSTFGYQVSNESAAVALKAAAAQAVLDTNDFNLPDAGDVAIRAGYVATTCHIARRAARAGETQLVEFTHRLQTSTGRDHTTSLAVVPAGAPPDRRNPLRHRRGGFC